MDDGIHLPTAAGCLLALAGAMHLAVGVEAFLADGTTLAALLVLWGVVALGGVAATAAGLLPLVRLVSAQSHCWPSRSRRV